MGRETVRMNERRPQWRIGGERGRERKYVEGGVSGVEGRGTCMCRLEGVVEGEGWLESAARQVEKHVERVEEGGG